jgi:multiple sugar transport system substrate-binding protein
LKDLYNLNRGINVKEAEFDKGKVAFKKFNLSEYRAYGTYPYKIIKYADFEWDVIPFPKGPQGQSKSKLYTLQIGISSRGRNKQIAYDFIKYMTSNEDLQEKVWELTYTLPANKNTVKRLYEEKKYKYEEFRKLNPDLLSDMISNSYRDPDFKLYSRLRKVIEQSIFEIMVRDLDVPRNVMELKKELQYVLDNYIGY